MGIELHISKAMIFTISTYYMSQLNSTELKKNPFDDSVQKETQHLSILKEN